MELSITYTLDDYREGLIASRKPVAASKRKREALWAGIVTAVVFIGLFIFGAAMQQHTPTGQVVPTFWSSFAILLLPWTLIVGGMWTLFVPRLDDINRPLVRQMMIVMIIAGLLNAWIGAANPSPEPAAAEKPATWKEFLVPWIPIAVIVVAAWFMLFRILRGFARRAWDGQPNMKLPQRMRISVDSLDLESEVMRTTYQWNAFLWFRETTNLLLLQPSKLTFLMIPKRACRDAAELESVRRILEQKVPRAEPRTFGFAVAATPPPLPRMVEPPPPRNMN